MTASFIRTLGFARNPEAAAQLVERTFNEGRADQYKRELTINAIQAGATDIHVTAVRINEESGIKAAFVDNGMGMSSTKIADYIGELFNGASKLVNGNFQMGARVSTLPFNRAGVIVASWTEAEPDGTILTLRYDEETGTYGVEPQYVDDIAYETGTPPAWLKHPAIAKAGHGTVVVLLGNDLADHTVGAIERDGNGEFEFPTARRTEDDWHYYNSKYWDLPEGVSLRFLWGPRYLSDWAPLVPAAGYARINEFVEGSEHKLTYRKCQGVDAICERVAADTRGIVTLVSDRGHTAKIHWALFPEAHFVRGTERGGASSDTRDHGIPLGLFGERLGDEVYRVEHGSDARALMEWYGIGRRELRDRLVLIVEPQARATATAYAASPTGSRDRLVIANGDLPHREWGARFAESLPPAIAERLRELDGTNTKDDAARQKKIANRLRELFGRPLRRNPAGEPAAQRERPAVSVRDRAHDSEHRRGIITPDRPIRPDVGRRIGLGDVAAADGPHRASTRGVKTPQSITSVWNAPAEFAGLPGLAVRWNEARRTLYFNPDHPSLRAIIEEEQAMRPAAKHGEIRDIARRVIQGHLEGLILTAEIYPTTTATGGQTEGMGSTWMRAVTDDAVLTTTILNVPAMVSLIRMAFQGRTGFGTRAPAQAAPAADGDAA
jgi:hypothetical protein